MRLLRADNKHKVKCRENISERRAEIADSANLVSFGTNDYS